MKKQTVQLKATMKDINKRRTARMEIAGARKRSSFNENTRLVNIENRRVADIVRYIQKMSNNVPITNIYELSEAFDEIRNRGSAQDLAKAADYMLSSTLRFPNQNTARSVINREIIKENRLPENDKKHKICLSTYKRMLDSTIIYEACDCMIENYGRICKRFNLNKFILENSKLNGIPDTVIELCKMVDTYDMSTMVKFNTTIESAYYGFESNGIEYNRSDVINTAVDYFLFKPDGARACKSILEATLFYDKNQDMKDVDIIMEDEPTEDESDNSTNTNYIDDEIKSYVTSGECCEPTKGITESEDFNELFKKFKKEEVGKDENRNLGTKFRELVSKLYSGNVDNVVSKTPNIFAWIRGTIIVGSCAIPVVGPILMCISFIADRFVSAKMDIKETKKMLKCFKNEIEISEKKLQTITDNDEKEKMNKYIKALKDAESKIQDHYYEIASDADEDEEDIDSYDSNDDDDFWDDDDDFLEECIGISSSMTSLLERSSRGFADITENTMYNLPSKLPSDTIMDMSMIVAQYPSILFREAYIRGLNSEIARVRALDESSSGISYKYSKLRALEDSLEAMKKIPVKESYSKNMKTANIDLAVLVEVFNAIDIFTTLPKESHSIGSITEGSIKNALRVASMKIREAFKKMSDKEKSISRSIDLSMNNLSKSVERSLTNDNREAVIKGSIIPQASKVVKLALANAGLILFHQPVIAVIMTLGYLGCQAKFKAKERQMLIDELDIEMQMCDKYIDMAEQKNDMKAYKQLLMTKRELQRQLQRVKYKLKVEMGKEYYDPKRVGD